MNKAQGDQLDELLSQAGYHWISGAFEDRERGPLPKITYTNDDGDSIIVIYAPASP